MVFILRDNAKSMLSYLVKLRGLEPGVLMNRCPEEAITNSNYTKKKSKLPMAEQAEMSAYRTAKGELYFPSEWFYQSMIKAAGEYQIPGRGKKTYKDFFKSNILIKTEQIEIGLKDYSVDARCAVNAATKGRVMAYRPHIPEWNIEFEITVIDEDLIDGETLNTILVRAGQTVGVGNYRPRFGRFIVESFQALK